MLNSLISDFNNSSENLEINYANSIIKINNNIAFIENYIYSSLQCFELSLPVVTQSREKITEIAKVKPENKILEEILNKENCLVISETTGNIILPYYIKDLENNKNTNKTYEQIIQDNYTLPISLFKPTFVARFREAFKLAHNKEKKSIIFSLN